MRILLLDYNLLSELNFCDIIKTSKSTTNIIQYIAVLDKGVSEFFRGGKNNVKTQALYGY